MSKAQHTPGPWSKHPYSSKEQFIVTPEDGSKPWIAYDVEIGFGKKRIASVSMQTVEVGYPCVDNKEECDANARLIAAAPELLEALEDVMAQLSGGKKSCGHEFHCVCPGDKARAAIAKAKGE